MSTNFRQFPPSKSSRYPSLTAPCPHPLPLHEHPDPAALMEIPPPYRPVMPMQLEPSPQRFTSPVSPPSPAKPLHALPLPLLPLQRPPTLSNRPPSILLPRGTHDPVPVIPAPSPKSRTGIVPVIPVFHGRRQAAKRLKVAGNPVAIPLPTMGFPGTFMSNVLYRVPDDTVVDVQKHLPNFEREEPESGSAPHPAASIPKSPPEMRAHPENIPDSPPLPNLPEDTLFNGGTETEQTRSGPVTLMKQDNLLPSLMRSLGSKNNLATMYGSSSCESLSSMVTASSTESLASMVTASSCDSLTSMANCSGAESTGPASPDRSNTTSPHILQLLNKITMEDSGASPDLKVECHSPIIEPVLDNIFTTMPIKTHSPSPTPRRFCSPSKHVKKWRFANKEREDMKALCASVKQQRRVLRTKQAQKLPPKDPIEPASVVRVDSAAYPRNSRGHAAQVPCQSPSGPELVPNKARSCRGCVKDKKKCDGGRPCHRCQKKGRVCQEPPRTRKRKFNEHFCWDCFHAKRPKYSFPSISNLRRHQRESCVFNPNRITRRVVSVIPSQVTAETQMPITLTFGGPLPKAESPGADMVGVYRGTAGSLIQLS